MKQMCLIMIVAIILVACASVQSEDSVGVRPSLTSKPSQTDRSIVVQRATEVTAPLSLVTHIPTATLTTLVPTVTSTTVVPTPIIPATLGVAVTPIPLSSCPDDDASVTVTVPNLFDEEADVLEKRILNLLNAGATAQLLAEYAAHPSHTHYKQVARMDITGDDIPEFIIHGGIPDHLFVFGCQQSQYVPLLVEALEPTSERLGIVEIMDLNANGIDELVIEYIECRSCFNIRILEWQTDHFVSLIRRETDAKEYVDSAGLWGFVAIDFVDEDNNGVYEVVLMGNIPSYLSAIQGFEGPYRARVVTYAWDGDYFMTASEVYVSPRFRFEAVRDGDDASVRGEFDKALAFYEDAIDSEELISWTNEAWFGQIDDEDPMSHASIGEMPYNEVEHAQLAAYANYRIMLLHLALEEDEAAKVYYEALVGGVLPDSAGYPYVALATEFWREYERTQNMADSCQKAIAYASRHEELLHPLGGNHGLFYSRYTPEQICLFHKTGD